MKVLSGAALERAALRQDEARAPSLARSLTVRPLTIVTFGHL